MIRPSALGDVCRTVPVIVSLKRAYPDSTIDWMVQDGFAEAVSHHPDVHRVVPFARKRFSRWWTPSVALELWRWLRGLRRARYDLVLDCQGLARSGLFAWMTGSRVRVGYSDASEGAWLGVNRRVNASRRLHTVDRMLALVESLGVPVSRDMRLYAPPGAWDQVLAQDLGSRLAESALAGAGQGYAVLAPTSRWPGKLWPAERFAETATRVLEDRSLGIRTVVLVGAEHERSQCVPLIELAAKDERVVDFIGKTSIGSLMALVERSSLVVANDSACLHMAVGFGRPLVGLYGPTDVSLVGPYQHGRCVVQCLRPGDTFDHKNGPLGRAMMERIGVEEVLAKVRDVLASDC